jgi:hypothetical protein
VLLLLTARFQPSWHGTAPDARTAAIKSVSNTDAFHLGTAAGPFGWSSVVADFDDDGRADFTLADRVAAAGGAYRYQLLFSVAGHAPQSVAFVSSVPALTIAVQDVDNDHDLDVLVTEAPTRIVHAVWLNDGHGRFVESPIRPVTAALMATVAIGSFLDRWSPSLLGPERPPAGDASGPRAGDRCSNGTFLTATTVATCTTSASTASPRAPPTQRSVSPV